MGRHNLFSIKKNRERELKMLNNRLIIIKNNANNNLVIITASQILISTITTKKFVFQTIFTLSLSLNFFYSL